MSRDVHAPAGHAHPLAPAAFPVDRITMLVELCRGRRVLNVGCADDTEVERKHAEGRHLHARLDEIATVVGVDLDPRTLAVQASRGARRLVAASALELPFAAGAFDDVVVGEVLEHLADPGLVLRRLRDQGLARRLVVTVPNAYSWYLQRELRRGVEIVNPDHLCTYTPVTLTTLLERAGWDVERLQPYAWSIPPSPAAALRRVAGRAVGRPVEGSVRPAALVGDLARWFAYTRQPFTGDGLVAVAT